MSRIVVVDNPSITVWLDPDLALIHHQMHGPCFRETFREALAAGVDAMKTHRATRWLSDDRANGALPPEDEKWAKTVWFPATQLAGWTHWALVQPEQVVGQLNMRRFTQTYAASGLTVRVFSDPEPALAWIASA